MRPSFQSIDSYTPSVEHLHAPFKVVSFRAENKYALIDLGLEVFRSRTKKRYVDLGALLSNMEMERRHA